MYISQLITNTTNKIVKIVVVKYIVHSISYKLLQWATTDKLYACTYYTLLCSMSVCLFAVVYVVVLYRLGGE